MTATKWVGLSAVLAVLVVAGLWWHSAQQAEPQVAPAMHGAAGAQRLSKDATGATGTGPAAMATASSPLASNAPKTSPLDTMAPPIFKTKPNGDLQIDSQARADVERIVALYGRDEAQARLDDYSAHLPPQAQRELKDLYQKYALYAQALAQTYPPGQSNASLDDMTRQLNGMHELRQQYFGAEQAELMFGDEERMAREMLETMRKQTDPNLTTEEKATLAQEALKKNHPTQP